MVRLQQLKFQHEQQYLSKLEHLALLQVLQLQQRYTQDQIASLLIDRLTAVYN